jgi:2'-5' RNA ligase
MRLFIAINFTDITRQKLLMLRDEVREKSKHGRFSLPENIHLTLAFLGECDHEQTTAAKAAMNAVTFNPFDIHINNVGRFKRHGEDVWWAGVAENKILTDLQAHLTDGLIKAGFTLEKRKYSPHITLGREIITDAKPWSIEPLKEAVNSIELMKSERINGKLTYTAIYNRK